MAFPAVPGDAEEDRLRAGLPDGRGQRQRVAVDDLAAPRLLAQLDQLVAGGEDRDPRPAIDRHGRLADGGQHADFRWADDRAGGNDRVAAPHVLPPETDMLGTLY